MVRRLHHDRAGRPLPSLAAPVDLRVYQGRAARVQPVGDGLAYSWGIEYRDASELQRIVDQLQGKPLTLLHPDGLISGGAAAKIVGKVRGARLVDDCALVEFEVSDPAGRAAIEEGIHELSLGYQCHTDEQGFQRGTVVDHLALVPAARCGPLCKLRPDSATAGYRADCASAQDAAMPCSCNAQFERYFAVDRDGAPREAKMDIQELLKQLEAVNKSLASEKTRADEAQRAFQAEKERADRADLARADAERERVAAEVAATNAQAALGVEKSRADQATAALAAEKTRADQAETKARADSAAAINVRATQRAKLFDAANRVLGAVDKDGKPVDRTDMSDRDLKAAIIKHVDGIDVLTHQAAQGAHFDVFVDGVFEGALERHSRAMESRTAVRETIQHGRELARGDHRGPGGAARFDDEETAMAKMHADTAAASERRSRRLR